MDERLRQVTWRNSLRLFFAIFLWLTFSACLEGATTTPVSTATSDVSGQTSLSEDGGTIAGNPPGEDGGTIAGNPPVTEPSGGLDPIETVPLPVTIAKLETPDAFRLNGAILNPAITPATAWRSGFISTALAQELTAPGSPEAFAVRVFGDPDAAIADAALVVVDISNQTILARVNAAADGSFTAELGAEWIQRWLGVAYADDSALSGYGPTVSVFVRKDGQCTVSLADTPGSVPDTMEISGGRIYYDFYGAEGMDLVSGDVHGGLKTVLAKLDEPVRHIRILPQPQDASEQPTVVGLQGNVTSLYSAVVRIDAEGVVTLSDGYLSDVSGNNTAYPIVNIAVDPDGQFVAAQGLIDAKIVGPALAVPINDETAEDIVLQTGERDGELLLDRTFAWRDAGTLLSLTHYRSGDGSGTALPDLTASPSDIYRAELVLMKRDADGASIQVDAVTELFSSRELLNMPSFSVGGGDQFVFHCANGLTMQVCLGDVASASYRQISMGADIHSNPTLNAARDFVAYNSFGSKSHEHAPQITLYHIPSGSTFPLYPSGQSSELLPVYVHLNPVFLPDDPYELAFLCMPEKAADAPSGAEDTSYPCVYDLRKNPFAKALIDGVAPPDGALPTAPMPLSKLPSPKFTK